MSNILEKLPIMYCDSCDIENHLCSKSNTYCEADIIHAYEQGRADAYEDAEKRLRYLWKQYEADKENVPRPQFTESIALITMLELDVEEQIKR